MSRPRFSQRSAQYDPLPNTIALIDPISMTGKLRVPFDLTEDTKGRQEWVRANGNLKKDLSVCCLFQQGRCQAGPRCHQVHVDRSFITEERRRNQGVVTCCRHCGDTASVEETQNDWFAQKLATLEPIIVGGVSQPVPTDRFARTLGFESMIRGSRNIRQIPAAKICRLHLKGQCKYGKDCKNIHICEKLYGTNPSVVVEKEKNKEIADERKEKEISPKQRHRPTPLSASANVVSLPAPVTPAEVQPTPTNTANVPPVPAALMRCGSTPTSMLTTFCNLWQQSVPSSPLTLPSPVVSFIGLSAC